MRLIVGVGAARDVPADELDALIDAALDALIDAALAGAGVAAGSIAALATVDRKAAEPGIVAVAARRGWPVIAFPAEELAAEAVPNPSTVVAAATGTPSVAEAAALRAAGPSAVLLVEKRSSASATVAIAGVMEGGVDVVVQGFWRERHLCTLTTLRPNGTPHVVPVGATLDAEHGLVRVIASGTSRKVANVAAAGADGAPVAVCQVDGRRWSTVEGRAVVRADAASVAEAVRRYAERYRQPRPNPERVAIEIRVTRMLGNV